MYLKRKRGRTSSKGKTCKALPAVRSSCRSPRLAEWTIVRSAPLSNNGPSRPFPSFLKEGAPAPSAATGCYALRLSSRDSRQLMFEALKSTKRSSTRISFAYFIPCMHSFGSMTPRLLTILKLPMFAWAMYMFIRT